jgi:hypothetical protein
VINPSPNNPPLLVGVASSGVSTNVIIANIVYHLFFQITSCDFSGNTIYPGPGVFETAFDHQLVVTFLVTQFTLVSLKLPLIIAYDHYHHHQAIISHHIAVSISHVPVVIMNTPTTHASVTGQRKGPALCILPPQKLQSRNTVVIPLAQSGASLLDLPLPLPLPLLWESYLCIMNNFTDGLALVPIFSFFADQCVSLAL